MIEVSDHMMDMLAALQNTGLYGPTVETAAQRIIEQTLFAMVMDEGMIDLPNPDSRKRDGK